MSKTSKLIIIVLALGFGLYLFWPSIRWYGFLSPQDRIYASGTKTSIKSAVTSRSTATVSELLSSYQKSQSAALPSDLLFLAKRAKKDYKNRTGQKNPLDVTTVAGVLSSYSSRRAFRTSVEGYYRDQLLGYKSISQRMFQLGLDLQGGLSVVVKTDSAPLAQRLKTTPTKAQLDQALTDTISVIRDRIDSFGVSEPTIRRFTNRRILIELPGTPDLARVNSVLEGKGSLSFHLVDDSYNDKLSSYLGAHQDEMQETLFKDGVAKYPNEFSLPAGKEVAGLYKSDKYGLDQFKGFFVVDSEPALTGDHIVKANPARRQVDSAPIVAFDLDSSGASIFYNVTKQNVGKSLAVVVNGRIKGAVARITEAIAGGSVSLTGFTEPETQTLAKVLRTGALPLGVSIESSSQVGGSLSTQARDRGIESVIIAFIVVVLFMLFYYKASGINAALALILNLYFTLALLSSFGFTLTLTSLAGLVLTVGMAVDANVIIFERIKEELRDGKSRAVAISMGFKKAFWAIMDANVTTFIAAVFLSQVGTGAVQGFAVTLAIGIATSLFTAIFVSHFIFDVGTDLFHQKHVSIGWGIRQ